MKIKVTAFQKVSNKHKKVAERKIDFEPNQAATAAGFTVETYLRREDVDLISIKKMKE